MINMNIDLHQAPKRDALTDCLATLVYGSIFIAHGARDKLSLSIGLEQDFGPMRDPGDRSHDEWRRGSEPWYSMVAF